MVVQCPFASVCCYCVCVLFFPHARFLFPMQSGIIKHDPRFVPTIKVRRNGGDRGGGGGVRDPYRFCQLVNCTLSRVRLWTPSLTLPILPAPNVFDMW